MKQAWTGSRVEVPAAHGLAGGGLRAVGSILEIVVADNPRYGRWRRDLAAAIGVGVVEVGEAS